MLKVKRALISVSDKKGIVPFARGLHALGVEILSTGGTAKQLVKNGIPVTEVSQYTGFPEMLDGRVKTLHPVIHAGLLAVRDDKDHMKEMQEHEIGLIDMVVVNLYPFERVVGNKNATMEDAIENIDIGGPSMLRSAAKNYKSVAVVCDPEKYDYLLSELDTNSGLLSDSVLFKLAVDAFLHTAHYDEVISAFFRQRLRGKEEFEKLPRELAFKFSKIQDLRYGENPHQEAAFYKDAAGASGLSRMTQLNGKELSFNNILDLNAALEFLRDLRLPSAVIIKHNNPTGIAEDRDLAKAYKDAWSCDKVSAFGGIIGLNRKVDRKTAGLISRSGFMECVIAPGFDQKALALLTKKKNLRLIELDFKFLRKEDYDFKKVFGGLLIQDKDHYLLQPNMLRVVTRKKPTKKQIESMMFGWQVIKNVKSNAIVLVKGHKTVGIGCGQTSRVESVQVAIRKAQARCKGAVLISDAFFPMTDNIKLAARAGIKAIIQTGGSIADNEVIQSADRAGISMVMTGVRHFKH